MLFSGCVCVTVTIEYCDLSSVDVDALFPCVSGSTDNEKRRVGVRGHDMGGTNAMHAAALRRTHQRAGGGEQQPLVPKRRVPAVPAQAAHVSQGDLRPDGRVLEAERCRPAAVRRDTLVPATKEPGVHSDAHPEVM